MGKVEIYTDAQRLADEAAERHKRVLGPDWQEALNLKVIEPLVIDQDGNEVTITIEPFIRGFR